jgi:hypothetical protein
MSRDPKMPVVIIACKVLQSLLLELAPAEAADNAVFMDYGLHRQPGKMTHELQEKIDGIEAPSLILLGYGLCGKGSRQAYRREFNAVPGTYYLSKGWLESGSHPLKEYEEYSQKYGREKTAWIMEQQYKHYNRLALVGHSQSDLEECRPQAQKVARYCRQWDMRYEELLGSDEYVRRLVDISDISDSEDKDFVIIAPGGEIRLGQFIFS